MFCFSGIVGARERGIILASYNPMVSFLWFLALFGRWPQLPTPNLRRAWVEADRSCAEFLARNAADKHARGARLHAAPYSGTKQRRTIRRAVECMVIMNQTDESPMQNCFRSKHARCLICWDVPKFLHQFFFRTKIINYFFQLTLLQNHWSPTGS